MRKAQILSGEELVAKGATKNEALLPEAGVKDVIPNGSWLEQKQIQAAVEARKHLIEVERIEKCGVLSHAEWVEALGLARVTQQAGSYWQHLGHHDNKQLYLYPEEALYLMEVNCLQLKYNKVTVSLQQAYSLLLRGKINLFQYKVYSSLSRTGYKIFRHQITNKIAADESRDKCSEVINEKEVKTEVTEDMSLNEVQLADDKSKDVHVSASSLDSSHDKDNCEMKKEITIESPEIVVNDEKEVLDTKDLSVNYVLVIKDTSETMNVNLKESDVIELDSSIDKNVQMEIKSVQEQAIVETNGESEQIETSTSNLINSDESKHTEEIPSCSNEAMDTAKPSTSTEDIEKPKPLSTKETIIQKLVRRKSTSLSRRILEKHFENVPDCQKTVVTVKVPDEAHLPRNVFLNNTAYVLNMDDVTQSGPRQARTSTQTYSASDEPNNPLVRRIRRSSSNSTVFQMGTIPSWNIPQFIPNRFPRFPQQPWFRPPPQFTNTFNTFNSNTFFNFIFQRHFAPPMNFAPRYHFHNRQQAFRFQFRCGGNPQNRESRKRKFEAEQKAHLQNIRNLAFRLKNIAQLRNPNYAPQNTQALQRLIDTYNSTYKASLKLDHNFDIITQENIVETIELEDDGPSDKRARETTDNSSYEDKLKRVKQLATRLKDLTEQGKAFARHRRAFSNMIMNFNKSFNADVYLDLNFEIIDRRHIVLDSSSESDCVIDEKPEKPKKQGGKKLRNPFSVLNHFCLANPSQRKQSPSRETNKKPNNVPSNFKSWIPKEDFGKPANISKEAGESELILASKAEYLYDFMREYRSTFDSWAQIKMSFWDRFEEAIPSQDQILPENDVSSNCLVTAEDCKDIGSVLRKLRIFETCKTVLEETTLKVDFDAYNRDVQNFRKSNRPVPHFRILCIKDGDNLPSGEHLETLFSQYKDQVPVVFAIVGVGSISYLQMKTTDIPVFIPTNHTV